MDFLVSTVMQSPGQVTILALGPLVGIIAMWRLRRRPEAVKMAGGRR